MVREFPGSAQRCLDSLAGMEATPAGQGFIIE
jgi:hypothetical protein